MILFDKTCYEHILKINLASAQSSDDVTLLGEIIYKTLTIKKHINNLVRKAPVITRSAKELHSHS